MQKVYDCRCYICSELTPVLLTRSRLLQRVQGIETFVNYQIRICACCVERFKMPEAATGIRIPARPTHQQVPRAPLPHGVDGWSL